jgi:hypothetical protein
LYGLGVTTINYLFNPEWEYSKVLFENSEYTITEFSQICPMFKCKNSNKKIGKFQNYFYNFNKKQNRVISIKGSKKTKNNMIFETYGKKFKKVD